jgi:hypothetical protein
MAVAAIDSHRSDVVGMTERDRLLTSVSLTRGVARVRDQLENHPTQTAYQNYGDHYARTSPRIRTWLK